MNLIKTFISRNTRLDLLFKRLVIIHKLHFQLAGIAILALLICYAEPYIASERRIYFIALIFLAWLLKFIIFDLDIPYPYQYKNPALRKKLIHLQNNLLGAIGFLNKTSIPRHPKKMKMNELPCYLLMGPASAGKTSLLKNAGIHFILQKHTQPATKQHTESTQCDWWVTREASMIDIPGKYIHSEDQSYATLWMFFIKLVRKLRGKRGINGIIIALPASEIINLPDIKNYNLLIRDLFQRIQDLQKIFARPISCQLVITKCDLMPGFKEFFAETSTEEAAQTLGVSLPPVKDNENLADIFNARFNALIKNINHQLLWRLHQERNPLARPAIKEFPLQMEKVKEFTADFIKKFSIMRFRIDLQGVYIMSACQPDIADKNIHEHPVDTTTRVIQIFREPVAASRAYFIKQFFTLGLNHADALPEHKLKSHTFKVRLAYAASIGSIIFAAAILGKDFQKGIKQTAAISNHITDYQHQIAKMNNPYDHLINTINLLNALQASTIKPSFRFDLSYLLSIYSHQAQEKAIKAYHDALHQLLLPEIKNYLEEYLTNPVNKDATDIYAVLKSYLMLGNNISFNAEHITGTLQKILSDNLQEDEAASLMIHLKNQLAFPLVPMALNNKKITTTRQYLNALPPLKLSFIILKNMDNNYGGSGISIEKENVPAIFANQQLASDIPLIFTAKMFNTVYNEQVSRAIKEAYSGNAVLGQNTTYQVVDIDKNQIDQLRINYVSEYVEAWESLLKNIHLSVPADLAATDAMIENIIGDHSPLLYLLKTIHDNTNFEVIMISSPKLSRINSLVKKTDNAQKTLYTIFAGMESLHLYLQTILHSENIKQAAFHAVSSRMSGKKPDAITQLRLIAEDCPPPIRQWLIKISDNSWNYILQAAGQYLDISLNTHLMPYDQTKVAGQFTSAVN